MQPLLEQRTHRENACRAELLQARRSREDAAQRVADFDRRCAGAARALTQSALHGNVAGMQAYDAMLREEPQLRLRYGADLRAHDAALEIAAAALTIANRERRTLERLRERLEARRARCRYDD